VSTIVSLPANILYEAKLYARRHGIELNEALQHLVTAGLKAETAAMIEAREAPEGSRWPG
jgi:hypothetical protein